LVWFLVFSLVFGFWFLIFGFWFGHTSPSPSFGVPSSALPFLSFVVEGLCFAAAAAGCKFSAHSRAKPAHEHQACT
jgi:hypothetical protein